MYFHSRVKNNGKKKRKGISNLKTLEKNLKLANIQTIFSNNKTKVNVEVSLPKFKIQSTIDMNEVLKSLGIRDLFDEDYADLSNIGKLMPPLFVSDVLQKAVIEVDETGSEAAAATVVKGRVSRVQKVFEVFKVDRPFVFLLRDLQTGMLLFQGRVTNPLEEG